MDQSPSDRSAESPHPKPNQPSHFQRLVQGLDLAASAKTILDFEACRNVVSRFSVKQEALLRQQNSAPTPTTPLESVCNYQQAAKCDSTWEQMPGNDRVRFCSACQLNVYNFSGIGQAEAENIIFQKEASIKPVFYRRRDGKFLTKDCPVGVRRVWTGIGLAAGVLFLLAAVVGWLMLMPPSPQKTMIPTSPAPVNQPQTQISQPEIKPQPAPAAQSPEMPTEFPGLLPPTQPQVPPEPQASPVSAGPRPENSPALPPENAAGPTTIPAPDNNSGSTDPYVKNY